MFSRKRNFEISLVIPCFFLAKTALGPLLGHLGASWVALGSSRGVLGGPQGPLGSLLGPLGCSSGASWVAPGLSWGSLGCSWVLLGCFLGASWALLGALGSLLGCSWGLLARPWVASCKNAIATVVHVFALANSNSAFRFQLLRFRVPEGTPAGDCRGPRWYLSLRGCPTSRVHSTIPRTWDQRIHIPREVLGKRERGKMVD